MTGPSTSGRVNFGYVNGVALSSSLSVCQAFLPGGKRQGVEWVALNPARNDRKTGSLKVNLSTGKWADFAVSDARGGDLVSLVAWTERLSQREAAIRLAEALGINPYE